MPGGRKELNLLREDFYPEPRNQTRLYVALCVYKKHLMPFECHVFSKAGTRKFLVEKHLQNPMWKVVSAFATALFSVIMGIPLYWGVSQEAHYILPG